MAKLVSIGFQMLPPADLRNSQISPVASPAYDEAFLKEEFGIDISKLKAGDVHEVARDWMGLEPDDKRHGLLIARAPATAGAAPLFVNFGDRLCDDTHLTSLARKNKALEFYVDAPGLLKAVKKKNVQPFDATPVESMAIAVTEARAHESKRARIESASAPWWWRRRRRRRHADQRRRRRRRRRRWWRPRRRQRKRARSKEFGNARSRSARAAGALGR